MPLEDRPPTVKPRGSCGLTKVGLSDDELALVESWLVEYPDQAVATRLAEDGYEVSYQILAKHRLQRCHCFR